MSDTLTPAPVPDRFEHETPLRAFSEWNETGLYAIGKGLRPSVAHLPVYLDAIERKEGWQLVQMLLDSNGNFRSGIFRRRPRKALASPALAAGYSPGPVDDRDPYATLAELARQPELSDAMEGALATLGSITKEDIERYDAEQTDDPVNPKHYGGTACAEIGERLTANCYQVLKYCWRLGEKDDPKTELGKAIWYADREKSLGIPRSRDMGPLRGMTQGFVCDRTIDSPWRRTIALLLWEMCYGTGSRQTWIERTNEMIGLLECRLIELSGQGGQDPCTTGLAI